MGIPQNPRKYVPEKPKFYNLVTAYVIVQVSIDSLSDSLRTHLGVVLLMFPNGDRGTGDLGKDWTGLGKFVAPLRVRFRPT